MSIQLSIGPCCRSANCRSWSTIDQHQPIRAAKVVLIHPRCFLSSMPSTAAAELARITGAAKGIDMQVHSPEV